MDKNKVIAAQLERLHAGNNSTAIFSIALSLITFLVLNAHSPHQELAFIALISLWLSYFIRSIDSHFFKQKNTLNIKTTKYYRRYFTLSSLSAMTWAALMILLLPQEASFQALTLLILVGVAAAAIASPLLFLYYLQPQ